MATTRIITSSSTPPSPRKERRVLRIALVCDFFYPRLGGVEMHIYSLAQCLVKLGHKVIVITHMYHPTGGTSNGGGATTATTTARTGVRYLPGPVKVYYLPIPPLFDGSCLPTCIASYPLLRHVFLRERIDIVHSHQATSTLGNEALVYAAQMDLGSVYTDHSLFGFDDVASVVLNRVLEVTLSSVDRCICVSHTCSQNLILRAGLDEATVRVIPNAVDATKFYPDPAPSCTPRKLHQRGRLMGEKDDSSSSEEEVEEKIMLTIIILSRLVYRKGVDLMVGLIPQLCRRYPHINFVIGGDGNKRLDLEEMVEREQLQDRIEFLGAVPHASVRDVLVRGQLFLNCSLTESFCIALLEAASCGLFVVSTNVGGVPEVLPPDMIGLSEPSVGGLVGAVSAAIESGRVHDVNPVEFHDRVARMYSWDRVARQTVRVYEEVMDMDRLTLLQRLERYRTVGTISGYVACIIALLVHFWAMVVELWQPRHAIDVVPDLFCWEKATDASNTRNVNAAEKE